MGIGHLVWEIAKGLELFAVHKVNVSLKDFNWLLPNRPPRSKVLILPYEY